MFWFSRSKIFALLNIPCSNNLVSCLTVIRFLIILLFTSFIIQELICSTVNGLAFSSATDFDLPFSTVFAQSEATDFAASGATADFTTSVATDLTPIGITIYLLYGKWYVRGYRIVSTSEEDLFTTSKLLHVIFINFKLLPWCWNLLWRNESFRYLCMKTTFAAHVV